VTQRHQRGEEHAQLIRRADSHEAAASFHCCIQPGRCRPHPKGGAGAQAVAERLRSRRGQLWSQCKQTGGQPTPWWPHAQACTSPQGQRQRLRGPGSQLLLAGFKKSCQPVLKGRQGQQRQGIQGERLLPPAGGCQGGVAGSQQLLCSVAVRQVLQAAQRPAGSDTTTTTTTSSSSSSRRRRRGRRLLRCETSSKVG
jgi:hypothetical protein